MFTTEGTERPEGAENESLGISLMLSLSVSSAASALSVVNSQRVGRLANRSVS